MNPQIQPVPEAVPTVATIIELPTANDPKILTPFQSPRDSNSQTVPYKVATNSSEPVSNSHIVSNKGRRMLALIGKKIK